MYKDVTCKIGHQISQQINPCLKFLEMGHPILICLYLGSLISYRGSYLLNKICPGLLACLQPEKLSQNCGYFFLDTLYSIYKVDHHCFNAIKIRLKMATMRPKKCLASHGSSGKLAGSQLQLALVILAFDWPCGPILASLYSRINFVDRHTDRWTDTLAI